MHSKEPIVYKDVSAEQFAALEKLAQSHHLSIVGTSGRTQKDGYDVQWDYSADKKALTITVFQSPFWMLPHVIDQHFENWLDEAADSLKPAESAPSNETPEHTA